MNPLKALPIVLALALTLLLSSTSALNTMSTENKPLTLVNFSAGQGTKAWQVEDDVVMGGRSEGAFKINREGHGVFHGEVSLENNGGFSSVHHNFDSIEVVTYRKVYIRVKGDGKTYQFRVKSNHNERPSYAYEFETTGDWQTIEVPLEAMYPSYRGKRLSLPNYPGQSMSQIRFLIAPGRAEAFSLRINAVYLR